MGSVRRAGQRTSTGGVPFQAEAAAFFARFTTSASPEYRAAVNQFIYEMKKAGLWTSVKTCKFFAAATQADALRDLISAARDATIVGAPTFTAGKGFSALNASDRLNLGVSYSSLFADNNFGSAIAATVDVSSTGSGQPPVNILVQDGGSYGSYFADWSSGPRTYIYPGLDVDGPLCTVVFGHYGSIVLSAGYYSGASSISVSARGSNLRSNDMAAFFGHIAWQSGLTGKQGLRIVQLFTACLTRLGAFT